MRNTPNRSQNINLRVTPGEKTLIEERAAKANSKVGAYLRRLGLGEGTTPAAKRASSAAGPDLPPDFEARVAATALRMPRRAAENVVKKEIAREAAKAGA